MVFPDGMEAGKKMSSSRHGDRVQRVHGMCAVDRGSETKRTILVRDNMNWESLIRKEKQGWRRVGDVLRQQRTKRKAGEKQK